MSTFLASDGCRLTYDVAGNGEALLLVPGLGGMAGFWSGIVPMLSRRFQVISFDHRGTGRSDREVTEFSIARIAKDAVELLQHLSITRTHVVGHSTGGVISQFIALDFPDIVQRLVISGSWDKPDERFRTLFQARLEILQRAGAETYQRLTHALGYPASYLEAHRAALEQTIEKSAETLSPIEVTEGRLKMLLSDERSTQLHKIDAETLVIGAEDDPLIPPYHSERIASAIPRARLLITEGSHFFPKVDPEQYATIVGTFLEHGHV